MILPQDSLIKFNLPELQINFIHWEGSGLDRSHAVSQGTGENLFPQAERGMALDDGTVRYSSYGPWSPGYRFTPLLRANQGGD